MDGANKLMRYSALAIPTSLPAQRVKPMGEDSAKTIKSPGQVPFTGLPLGEPLPCSRSLHQLLISLAFALLQAHFLPCNSLIIGEKELTSLAAITPQSIVTTFQLPMIVFLPLVDQGLALEGELQNPCLFLFDSVSWIRPHRMPPILWSVDGIPEPLHSEPNTCQAFCCYDRCLKQFKGERVDSDP